MLDWHLKLKRFHLWNLLGFWKKNIYLWGCCLSLFVHQKKLFCFWKFSKITFECFWALDWGFTWLSLHGCLRWAGSNWQATLAEYTFCSGAVSWIGLSVNNENCSRLLFLLIFMENVFTYFPAFWQFSLIYVHGTHIQPRCQRHFCTCVKFSFAI